MKCTDLTSACAALRNNAAAAETANAFNNDGNPPSLTSQQRGNIISGSVSSRADGEYGVLPVPRLAVLESLLVMA